MEIKPIFPSLDILHKYFEPEKTTPEDVRYCLTQESYMKEIAKRGENIDTVVEKIMQKLQAILSGNNEEQ